MTTVYNTLSWKLSGCEITMKNNEESKLLKEDKKKADNVEKMNGTHVHGRLGLCEVCAAQAARYTCPKCEVKTCCIRCLQIHKLELNCNGIRDRTKYIPMREMTATDFMRDYYFLEECTRYVDDRKTDRIKQCSRFNKNLCKRLETLRRAATERKTILHYLAPHFTRHKENTTFYNWNEKRIYWCIEWNFINASNNSKFIDAKCSEDELLHKLLDKYVGTGSDIEELMYYQSAGKFHLRILLKAECIKNSNDRFYELDCNKTLRENLRRKTLIEYPCIYVSYEQESTMFNIIDSDDDIEKETRTHEMKINQMQKEEHLKMGGKNIVTEESKEQSESKTDKLTKLFNEKNREDRKRKRKQYENGPKNFLFSDDKLLDILSTSEDDSDEKYEEKL